MVMDITHLRQFLTQVIDTLDHQHIDNIEWFKTRTSTAENIVVYIWNQLFALIPSNVKMEEIVLTETDKNQVVYRGQ